MSRLIKVFEHKRIPENRQGESREGQKDDRQEMYFGFSICEQGE